MNIGHIGIGVDAFSRGLLGGMQLGREIKTARNERQIEQIRKEGLEAAKSGRDADIQANMQQFDFSLPEGQAGPQMQGWEVGGQRFTDEKAARGAAGKDVMSVEDRFYRDAVPRIADAYIGQGDIEKAEAWRTYAESREQKKAFGDWAKAFRASQLGDTEAVADYVFNQYKASGTGVTPMSKEVVKDDGGKITGYNVRLKNDETGEEYSQFIDNASLLEMGLQAFSPPQQFEMAYTRQMEADKMGAQARIDAQKDQRRFERDVSLEKLKAGLRTQGERSKFDAGVQALRDAGYTDQFINSVVPQLLGVKPGESMYRKPQSPEETARMLFQERMRNDFRFKNMPPAEQQRLIQQDLTMLQQLGGNMAGQGRVESSGLPGPSGGAAPAPAPGGGRVPIYIP